MSFGLHPPIQPEDQKFGIPTLHYKARHSNEGSSLQSLREMAHLLSFILVALSFVFLPSNSAATLGGKPINNSEIDRQALLSFKAGISADPHGVLRSWRSHSLNFCSWRGISCGKALPPRVVSMELNSSQLVGELSPSLANLTFLKRLDLGINMFSGGIPDELGTLPKLKFLMLATNNFSGNIPGSLGSRSGSLAYVNLAENALIGGIPHLLAISLSLSVLNLTRNSLSGIIPASLFNGTSKLVVFDIAENLFSGPIPDFHKLVSLEILALSENNISGSIPPSLGNVSSLSEIWLNSNNLGGSIPETLSQIQNLKFLHLGSNNLSGHVPSLFYNMSSLIYLDLSQNSLKGRIPSGISLPNQLLLLDMSDNWLKGPLPASLVNNASQLLVLDLRSNLLSGPIPSEIGNLASLELLDLGQNKLTNTIPISICYLSKLQMLAMDQNFLSGGVPPIIANITGLVILNISKNKLSGQIPTTMGELSQLNKLYLDNNNFSGNIPGSLGNCTQLVMLNLSANNLNGSIPSQLISITSLTLSLDLSNNYFTGSIPPQIGKLIHLVFLDISFNNLSGQLPSLIGQCVSLLSLNMARNMLNGTLPQSLGNLKSVSWIDLSHNSFVGQIPDIFSSFTLLIHLDLSNNHLEGPIPTGGVFQNITATDLYGNLGLCANATTSFVFYGFPICPKILARRTKNIAHLLVIVIPPITIALFSCLCFMVTLLKKGPQTTPCYKETMKKVSYGDILKATNWFSPINKISSSQTSSIYLGRFEFDTDLVAIKLFHLHEHGSLNSFHMECEVLKNSRHRNLMKAVTLCSTVDSENNEFKAIVFDFMANGSLDMWVHPKLYQTSPTRRLSLGQRIRKAMDVASALDYMHNQLTPPLVHCDLKPANVLLDYDMTARVGDFGSAKFLTSGLDNPEGIVGTGGTIGYIAPEYGMGYKISTGSDVYSFGVLLLEMFTGKRPTDTLFIDGMNLHKFVSSAYPDRLVEVLDPYMSQEGSHACADLSMQSYQVRMVEVALLCSMESPKDRPAMQDVCAKIFAIKEAFLESW